jgi:phosphatidylglycerol:prolipoprotein diacylglycerol transferase
MAAIFWDPYRELFYLPWVGHPVGWYGICFALGFVLAYFVVAHLFHRYISTSSPHLPLKVTRRQAFDLTDRTSWYVVFGTIVGARLGHVFFYAWPYYQARPLDILKVWEGGLASHGGVIGVILAVWIFQKVAKKQYAWLSYLTLLDCIAVASGLVCGCIRIGNFFNQEIVGTPTNVPWAIIFGHPEEDRAIVARHPVQLYESVFYFGLFVLLFWLWSKRGALIKPGGYFGLMLAGSFAGRLLLETWKVRHESYLDPAFYLSLSQWLCVPFIIIGMALMWRSRRRWSIRASSH